MVWKTRKRVKFLVKSFYFALELEGEVSFPSKVVWASWAFIKVRFFEWQVA